MNGRLRSDIVLEQTLGHVTHSQNLQRMFSEIDGLDPTFLPVPFDVDGPAARIPGYSNWTIRAGLRARRLVAATWRRRGGRPDAMFVHTQVPAVLLGRRLTAVPTVVSLDATPKQYDELGEFYAHDQGPEWAERIKFRLNRRCFERAAHVITWSTWAKDGLARDYGIDADHVTAIAPGVDVEQWRRAEARPATSRPVQILFVGGDLQRKGGDLLIDAVGRLRADPDVPDVELRLVTPADVPDEPGVFAHPGLTANSPDLIARYHDADIFCLPTLGDCLPMVLAEAAASGLPLVSTDVGAIHEIVRPDETGELVPTGDVDALTAALRRLVVDRSRRERLGQQAVELAEREHNVRTNAGSIVEILRDAAGHGPGSTSGDLD